MFCQTVFAGCQLMMSSGKCTLQFTETYNTSEEKTEWQQILLWKNHLYCFYRSTPLTHKLSCTGIWISYNFSPVDLRIAKLYIFWKLSARAFQWCMVLLCADQQQKSYCRFLAHLLIHLLITHWVRSLTTTSSLLARLRPKLTFSVPSHVVSL